MKFLLIISFGLTTLSRAAFCQCPQPGIKIVSAACEPPRNLKVSSATCSTLIVKWNDSKDQAYLLNAVFTDAASNPVVVEASGSSCDDQGNCGASFIVKAGSNISWSVQAICSTEGVIVYSSKVTGPDAYISNCEKTLSVAKVSKTQIYPNPATNYLMVDFNGKVSGNIEFKVFDMAGKSVYNKFVDGVLRADNKYKLDLRNLLPGTYMLELHHNTTVTQTKFVLMRK